MSRILLVDDDLALRSMLKLGLESLGYSVVEASDGREGLRLFKDAGIDVVLTDLIMPEKEGIELIMELKRLPGKSPKIIAMSGGGHIAASSHLNIARILGVKRMLAKPFGLEELHMAIEAELNEA
jgi:DNA-binding response OmpR family regulator